MRRLLRPQRLVSLHQSRPLARLPRRHPLAQLTRPHRQHEPRPDAHPCTAAARLGAVLAGLCWLALLLVGPLASTAAATTGGGRATPGGAVVPGAWRWPLDGVPRVTRRFDPPDTPYGAGHRGVDLAGTPGAAVRAAGSGRVGYAGMLAGRGVVTVIHGGGLKTTYEPVRAVVHVGQQVAMGALLGRLQPGHPGCPVSACLHWGLLRGKTYLDPLSLVGAGRVRLLPLGTDSQTKSVAGSSTEPAVPHRAAATPASADPWTAERTTLTTTAVGAVAAAGVGLHRRHLRRSPTHGPRTPKAARGSPSAPG
jgi:hypothetical protein